MSKARWMKVALCVAGLSACASSQATQRAESSYRAGQAAQPGSWSASNVSEAPVANAAVSGEPAGQAAQQHSWLGNEPEAPANTPLAQDGPSYYGGRAGQPGSYAITPKRSNSGTWLSAAPSRSVH